MRKMLVMLTLLLFTSGVLLAQKTISGKVADEKGDPIANASVVVKGSTVGTTTNDAGEFTLNLPANAKAIIVSAIGASAKEISIGSATSYSVTLSKSEDNLDEVVVTGYGGGRKVGTIVGNVVTVSGKEISERPTANVLDALQGKVAGLQVYTSSGEPSATPSLRIHGVGSLSGGSTPLYVIDGVPLGSGSIVSLNPEDFASISVLKDASATSIYGSRAANGVVYITTKQGTRGKDATITLQSQYGVSNIANMKFFDQVMNRQELLDFYQKSGIYTQAQINSINATYPNNDTRWFDEYYKSNAPTYQVNLSATGGNDKTTYYLSGGYFSGKGNAYRSGFERYTFRSNITSTLNNWLKVGLNLSGGYDRRETNQYGSNSTNRGIAILAAPWYSPTYHADTGIIAGWNRYHPAYLEEKIQEFGKNYQFNPSGYIQLTPFKNFTLKTQAGMDGYYYINEFTQLPSYAGSRGNGNTSRSFDQGIQRTITNTAEYRFKLYNQHNITALAGQEFVDYKGESFGASSAGLTDDRLIMLSAGPNSRNVSGSKSEYSYSSFFGRVEYNYQNRYYLDLTGRQDESSRFGVDNRTGRFWSVGVLWKMKSEKFLDGMDWLTDLNFRANTGTSGNSPTSNYQHLATVGTNIYNGATGWGISAAGNSMLQWESQHKTTIGIDFSLFDRIRVDLSVYNRNTDNMMISVPYAYTSGFSSILSNVGTLNNKGIDLALNVDIFKKKDYYVSADVNLSWNKEELTELFQGKQYWIIPNTGVSWAVGQPVSFFYPILKGVNPETGDNEWYLPNTDPNQIVNTRKDPNAVTTAFNTAALQQNTGIKRYAPFNGGWDLNAGYKGFFLQAGFAFSAGKYLINNDAYFFENPRNFAGFNQSQSVNDFWEKPGDIATFPKPTTALWSQFDSHLIQNASFLRLKVFSLGYSVPQTVLNRIGVIKGVKVYATGRNLLTFTKYKGPDPEVDSNLSLGANPNTKQIAFGLDMTF